MTDRLITNDFRTPPGWGSGHLQTIRSRVVRQPVDLTKNGSHRSIVIDLDDGTGDRLAVEMHASRFLPRGANRGGLVTLIHGLGGSAESDYVRATADGLLHAGFNVARVNLRGAGTSIETSKLLYHAGRTEDLRNLLGKLALEPEATDNVTGAARLAVMGFSLGGNMTLKLMGEPHDQLPIFAAVSVSAPLDLTVGSEYLSRRALGAYEKFLLAGLKRQALQPGSDSALRVSDAERAAIRKARTLAAFDDVLTAPRNGWRDSAEYYEVNSSALFLSFIDVPTLVIHSLDDPMIPASPYRAVDWEALAEAGFVQRRITPRGGHVGFHERGMTRPWYVPQAMRFLSRA